MYKCKNTPLKTSYLCFTKKVLEISFLELMLHTETKNKNYVWENVILDLFQSTGSEEQILQNNQSKWGVNSHVTEKCNSTEV